MTRPENQTKINTYRLFVDEESTLLVRLWDDGHCEVATREARDHTWGPPRYLREEVTK